MSTYHSRESAKTRARKRRERLIRRFSLFTAVAALSAAGVFEWHRYVLDQAKRASPSWRSVPEVVRSETDELDLTVPQTETEEPTVAPPAGPTEGSTEAVASQPSSVGPSLKKRSGVATLFFSERELVSLDSDGKPVKKGEKLFAR